MKDLDEKQVGVDLYRNNVLPILGKEVQLIIIIDQKISSVVHEDVEIMQLFDMLLKERP